MKLSLCPCHETNHSALPRAKLLATQWLCPSWRTSAELPSAQLSTTQLPAELFAAELLTAQLLPSKGLSGVGPRAVLGWETPRRDRWKLLQSPGSHKERRSPCRRESRSCSRLGCQVLLSSLTVLELSRSNSQVQGLVTREPSVGLEGLGEMWVVGT